MNLDSKSRKVKYKQVYSDWSVVKIFLNLYLLFLSYVTYKPFNFSFNTHIFQEQLGRFIETVLFFRKAVLGSVSDIIANIIVFIPLGILLYWYKWEKKNFKYPVRITEIIIWIILTTSLIEFGQLLLITRHPSIIDIITNTLGGIAGFYISNHLIKNYNDFVRSINLLIQKKWDVKLLILLIFLMFSYAWFPFSFGANLWQLKYHLILLISSSTDIQNLFNAVPYMVLYFYLQVLTMEIVEKYSNINKAVLKISLSLFIVSVVSFLQFLGQSFVTVRTYNIDDLFMMFIGITFGIIFSYNLYIKGQLVFDKNNSYLLIILKVTLLLNFIFIIGASLFPLNWNLEYQYIYSKLMTALVPFNNFADSSKLHMLIDLAKDIFKFVPVTIIISAIYNLKGKRIPFRVYTYLFFAVTALEVLQIFHKNFNPDISDIFLGVFSLYLGRKIWVFGKISLRFSG